MPDSLLPDWQGRDDTAEEGHHANRWHQKVQAWTRTSPPGITLLGFACDEGVRRNQGRVGASRAPAALRRWLGNLAWHQAGNLYDAGNITSATDDLETAQHELGNQVGILLNAGQRPIVIGGGHETAWGTFLGITAHRPRGTMGIVNLDAHFDLRRSGRAHSGTSFAMMADWLQTRQMPFHYLCMGISEASNTNALFLRAKELNVSWLTDEELTSPIQAETFQRIEEFISKSDYLYLSTDLDVLPVSTMAAVSAPAALGVSLDIVLRLTQTLAQSGKLLAADVVEYNPTLDHNDAGARVAARVIWNLARHWQPRCEAGQQS